MSVPAANGDLETRIQKQSEVIAKMQVEMNSTDATNSETCDNTSARNNSQSVWKHSRLKKTPSDNVDLSSSSNSEVGIGAKAKTVQFPVTAMKSESAPSAINSRSLEDDSRRGTAQETRRFSGSEASRSLSR